MQRFKFSKTTPFWSYFLHHSSTLRYSNFRCFQALPRPIRFCSSSPLPPPPSLPPPPFSTLDPSSSSDVPNLRNLLETIGETRRSLGDFVPRTVTEDLIFAYSSVWCPVGRRVFLEQLGGLSIFSPNHNAALRESLSKFPSVLEEPDCWRATTSLRAALSPLHEDILRMIVAHNPSGMNFLVQMRGDLLSFLKDSSTSNLQYLNATMLSLLRGWFSSGFLELKQITWQSPGALLEKIGTYEKVHPTRRFTDLKVRLGPGRRCYAFTHPTMQGEPLVFIHVALVPRMASSLRELAEETGKHAEEGRARAAVFWSISATQPGLSGVDLGAFLIKGVVDRLREEWPRLKGADPNTGLPPGFVFSTLSPIPGFSSWLKEKLETEIADGVILLLSDEECLDFGKLWNKDLESEDSLSVAARLLKEVSAPGAQFTETTKENAVLKRVLMRLCARYLLLEKKRGRAKCPVANFHIRNGSVLQRINWAADVSQKGLSQSCGLMVNYQYHLPLLERNHTAYVQQEHISRSDEVENILLGKSNG
eukprot:g4167.t1